MLLNTMPRIVAVVLWLLVLVTASRVLSVPTSSQVQWMVWKSTHGRNYSSDEEEVLRYSLWLDNMNYIEQHNANVDKHGFSLKINTFGDLSLEEWTTFNKCHRPEDIDAVPSKLMPSKSTKSLSSINSSLSLPSAFDWRESNKVTKVKNQNEYRCHSCYAFASTAAVESAYAIKTDKLISLSAQQIVDCSRMYYNGGCNGGNYRRAWMYMMDNGIASATTYPYQSAAGTCHYKGEAVSMMYYQLLDGGENEILNTVAGLSPVLVSIDHRTRTFMFYGSGVYNNHLCSTHYSELTHEMLVVGYGPQKSSSSTPYWIIKNSYGTGWGIDGYIHMARGKNVCGIAADAGYPIV